MANVPEAIPIDSYQMMKIGLRSEYRKAYLFVINWNPELENDLSEIGTVTKKSFLSFNKRYLLTDSIEPIIPNCGKLDGIVHKYNIITAIHYREGI